MNKAFEKILIRISNLSNYKNPYDSYYENGMYRATEFENSVMNKTVESVRKIVKEVAEEYNNGWIACSERLPEECIEVLVSVKEIDGSIYTRTSWIQDDVWVIKKTPLNPTVIAWQPLPEPYTNAN